MKWIILIYLIIAFIHYGFIVAWLEDTYGMLYSKRTDDIMSVLASFLWPILFLGEVIGMFGITSFGLYADGWKLWYKK